MTRDRILDTIKYTVSNEYNKHHSNPYWEGVVSKKILNKVIDILDKYNEFLLKENYTDCDVICEEPTALDQFLNTK